jgi:hypothetical protein
MASLRFPTLLYRLVVRAFLLLGTPAAFAQVPAPHGYDFLTLTSMESSTKSVAKILITPAFQGKTEIQLEDFGGFSAEKNLGKLQHNIELVNQQLTELTAAGWELVQAYPFTSVPGLFTTRYLFRKAKS